LVGFQQHVPVQAQRGTALLVAVVFCTVTLAGVPAEDDRPPEFELVPSEAWRELNADVPAYPASGDLIPVDLDVPGSSLRAYLDETALSVGDDGVVRYVLVLKSGTGAENVLYEGIRCAHREYRTYAIGSHDKRMVPAEASAWKPLGKLGPDRYRDQLFRNYFCDVPAQPFPKRKILNFIKYGRTGGDG
jgi:hypothetical protein